MIGKMNPSGSKCSASTTGSLSLDTRMHNTEPFGLVAHRMKGGCIPCSSHISRISERSDVTPRSVHEDVGAIIVGPNASVAPFSHVELYGPGLAPRLDPCHARH